MAFRMRDCPIFNSTQLPLRLHASADQAPLPRSSQEPHSGPRWTQCWPISAARKLKNFCELRDGSITHAHASKTMLSARAGAETLRLSPN